MAAIKEKYKAALDYLFAQLPMFQRVGASAFKKDLTNTLALCEYLGNPHLKFPSIHVAGTNGKGSTSHMLAGILQAHGFKVGLYTSPHYKDFRERIKVNGKMIAKKAVVEFIEQHRAAFDRIQPSFFEWGVALAFDHFARQKVDIAIVEVGLGGRLDSTNIITPLVSVITNISFDHMQFLGNTLPEIAFEKAGIIKMNVPVVIGEEHPLTKSVFEKVAEEKNAPLTFAERQVTTTLKTASAQHSVFDVYFGKVLEFKDLELSLLGDYQQKNLQTVLQTFLVLDQVIPNFKLEEKPLRRALSDLQSFTGILGRWLVLSQKPLTLCDSAHNEDGLKWAMGQLSKQVFRKLHMVIGVVKDKDVSNMLALLPTTATYYFCKPDIPRGLDAKILRERAGELGLSGRTYSSVKNALQAAKRNAGAEDFIYVGGSTFVVAEVV